MNRPARLLAALLLALAGSTPALAGAYVFAGNANGLDLILHPRGYTGSESTVTVTVCIDPSSVGSTELAMQAPIERMISTWDALTPTTTNLAFGGSNNIPSGFFDLESAALHELGHCLGLAHVNAASESGLTGANSNYTKAEEGPNNVFNINDGLDNVIGTCDDQRSDDENLHWFRKATNDPFQKAATVDSLTYSRDLGDLPVGNSCNGGPQRFAANGDRSVGAFMGYPNTEAVMQQGMGTDEEQRTLTADDVATIEYAMSGLDEMAGTGDDYELEVVYGGIKTSGCDVTVKISDTSSLAFCSVGGANLPGNHAAITTARIEFGEDFNWFYGFSTLTVDRNLNGASSGTITSSPAGIACPGDCEQEWPSGQQVQLTATSPLGEKFSGWSGDADCSDGSVSLFTDTDCTANFDIAAQFELTVEIVLESGGTRARSNRHRPASTAPATARRPTSRPRPSP